MESRKQWMSLEERDSYRENNYWKKDGLPYNPRKFVRRKEVERIINANIFELKDEIDDKTFKVLENFVENVKIEIDTLESLYNELERRKRELDL